MTIRRTRNGRFRVHLDDEEREMLRGLSAELRALLESNDPAVGRLFPPAYHDDPEAAAEYERLMREELLDRHRSNLETLEATIGATELDAEGIEAWLGAVNELRLVLGTSIGITEETVASDYPADDPALSTYWVYMGLTWLNEVIVQALMRGMDPAGHPAAPAPPPELGDDPDAPR